MRSSWNDWKIGNYPSCNGLKVFGTFICAGGSTMGYKLAGFDHIGGVEIDKRVADIYRRNHSPKHLYIEDIRDFNKRDDLPEDLYDLDILDGSPPCTTFSMAGNREKGWGVKKKFNEGQAYQRLDDLIFVFCRTVEKLRPKTVLIENVPGMLAGRAKKYAIDSIEMLKSIGYDAQLFLLNSATMGVPQSRDRVFIIARRKDLNLKPIKLDFNKPLIPFKCVIENHPKTPPKKLWPSIEVRLPYVEWGDQNLKFADAKYRNKNTFNAFFSTCLLYEREVPPTLTASGSWVYLKEKRGLNNEELCRISSFPIDFDFNGMDVRYVCGMSVPPFMIKSIAKEMLSQWFN